jgi:hypothetical protein
VLAAQSLLTPRRTRLWPACRHLPTGSGRSTRSATTARVVPAAPHGFGNILAIATCSAVTRPVDLRTLIPGGLASGPGIRAQAALRAKRAIGRIGMLERTDSDMEMLLTRMMKERPGQAVVECTRWL